MDFFLKLVISYIFILFIISHNLFGNELDSLLQKLPLSDTPKEKVDLLLEISRLERNLDPNHSIEYNQEAIDLSEEIEDKTYLIISYNTLGITYKKLDSLDKSLSNLLKALSIAKSSNNKKWRINMLNTIGTLYMKFDQNEKALSYYEKSYNLAKSYKDTNGIANAVNNIGAIYWKYNKLDSSLKYIQESMEISLKRKDTSSLMSSYNNLAILQTELENYDGALKNYNLAMRIAEKTGNKWDIANIINNRNVLNVQAGKLDNVEKDAQRSLTLAKSIESKLLESDSYQILSDYYLTIGNYKKSLEKYKKYSKLNSEILNKETSDKLAEIQKNYEINKKDMDIKELGYKNKVQYYLIVFLGIVLLLSVIFIYVYYRKDKENKRISKELMNMNLDLTKLSKNRDKYFTLVSHDLKAPLYNISNHSSLLALYYNSMDEKEKSETLIQMKKSSQSALVLIDNILLWSKTQFGTLENKPELLDMKELIKECIEVLSPIADEKEITILNEAENISLHIDYSLISASIRNLISNAIKFSNVGSQIVIRINKAPNTFDICVQDQGIGIEPHRVEEINDGGTASTLGTNNEKGSGLGLRITKELISLVGGSLTAESQLGKGSNFTISLPLTE